ARTKVSLRSGGMGMRAIIGQRIRRRHRPMATAPGSMKPVDTRDPMMRRVWFAAFTLTAALLLGGCGYNDFQRLDEQVKGAWSEVLNQYQRRADLIPNIVATVKGEANFEQETLTRVVEARAKATSIQVTPETLNDPQA